ncbi:hypothetical protein Trydic_g21657 [Trypoxylus dichotomus]
MAVEKNESEVVQLLLTHGANLSIQNRDKLTPLELAEKLICHRNIIAALKLKDVTPLSPIANNVLEFRQRSKEQIRQTIDRKYIKEFDLEDTSQWSKIEAGTKDGTFKMLIINNATVNGALNLMLSDNFIKAFNGSSHLFLVDICVDSNGIRVNEDELKRLENMLDAHKPLVIQWRPLNSSKCCIFYKNPYESIVYLKQKWDDQLIKEQLFEELDNCQFPILLKALNFGLGGSFHGNLAETILDMSEEIESWKLIDYAAKNNDALSLRYLQLFNWSLHKMNASGFRTLEIASENASPQSISAILDLPDTNVPHELLPICWQRNLLKLKNLDGLTPALIATKCGKTETLEYLVNCGVEEDCLEAIKLAWNNQSYDKVVVLLNAETPFPDELDRNTLEHGALTKLINAREDFHQAIREDSREKIDSFIKQYPRLKQVLNRSNKSALTTARNAEKWDTYVYLQSQGFRFGNNENSNLTKEEREHLKQIKSRYFHKPDNSRITFLLSRSKLGHDSYNYDYFAEIKKLYEFLDEIPYTSTVMQVLEMSNIQQIVFDFNKESVVDLDPTLTEMTAGSCDYVAGNLYIGAKQPLGTLLGTLAHELTHFAMQTVFNNDCNPYTASDLETKRYCEEIVDRYYGREEIDSIIGRVYNYKRHEWPSELIVRVPHISVHYRGQQAAILRNKAPDLFNFYDHKIEGPFTQFIANPAYFKNQHLNDLLGQVDTALHSKVRFKDDSILSENDINRGKGALIFASFLPQLIKNDLLQALEKAQTLSAIKSRYIFTCIDQFENQDIVLKIRNSFKSNIKQTLVVDCSIENKINPINKEMLWNTIKNFDKQKRIVLITHERIADQFLKDANKCVQTSLVRKEYSWSDLDAESKVFLLTKTVNFQGYPVALNKLVSVDSECAKEIPLSFLMEGSPISIGKPLPTSYGYDEDYYIERTFEVATKKEYRIFPPNKVTDLLKQVQEEKVLIISDRAGIGKTTVLTHFSKRIKEANPSYWVIRLDLNDYTDVFEGEKRRISIESSLGTEGKCSSIKAIEFFRLKLLKLESTLEQHLFSEILEKKQIVIMLDGFDEISPLYSNIVLNLLVDLNKSPIEQLWVTTRPLLGKNLAHELQSSFYTLQPFTFKDQRNFLMRFWQKFIKNVSDETKLKKFAETLIHKLSKSIADSSSELASVPLQTRMLAEAFDEDLIDFYYSNNPRPDLPLKLDLLDVYRIFSHRKYLVYIFEKSSLLKVNVARENLAAILSRGVNLRKIHQQLALQMLFPEKKDKLVEPRKRRSLKPEELNRIGIVQYEGEKFYFVHRTFAEYYASDFFLSNLVKPRSRVSIIEDLFLDIILLSKNQTMTCKFVNSFLSSEELQIPNGNIKFYGDKIARLIRKNWLTGVDQPIVLQPIKTHWVWRRSWLIQENRPNILYTPIVEGNFYIVKFVFTCLISVGDHNALRSLYYAKNEQSKSIWLIAAEKGQADILELLWSTWKIINEEEITKNLKSILSMRDEGGQTGWSLSVKFKKSKIFDKLVEYAKEVKLTPEELIDLVICPDCNSKCVWYSVTSNDRSWVFNKLFILAKEIEFRTSHFKKLLLATNDVKRTVWHLVANGISIEVYYELRKWVEEAELGLTDVKQILSGKDEDGESIWHKIAFPSSRLADLDVTKFDSNKSALLLIFWEWAKKAGLTSDEIKSELLTENKAGETIWHLILKYKNNVVSSKLVNLVKEDPEINTEKFFTEVFERTEFDTLWGKAIYSSCMLQIIWSWIREAELTSTTIKRIILQKDKLKTVLHIVTESRNAEVLENFWRYAKETQLTDEDMKNLLFEKDMHGCTVWNSVIESDNVKIFDKLLMVLTEKFSPSPREFTNLLLEKRQDGCTWHYIYKKGSRRLLIRLLQVIDDQDCCRELILSKNKYGQNVFHLAGRLRKTTQCAVDILLILSEKARMTRDEFKQVLSIRDNRDRTALSYAFERSKRGVIVVLLKLGVDVKELDRKQCDSLKSFIRKEGGNRDLLPDIKRRLKELKRARTCFDEIWHE